MHNKAAKTVNLLIHPQRVAVCEGGNEEAPQHFTACAGGGRRGERRHPRRQPGRFRERRSGCGGLQ